MRKHTHLLLTFAALVLIAVPVAAQPLQTITLPKPRTSGGKPLLTALSERKTTRDFKTTRLPLQTLSDLLLAADGVNRPDGRRTAPSAMNRQEIEIYVALEEGIYLFDARTHTLKPAAAGDLRAQTGGQGFVATAPLNLVYIADYARMGGASQSDKDFYSAADTGFIAQNVYLFCASEGLGVVVRGTVDRSALARTLKLRPDQKVLLAQTVGMPR